MCAVRQSRETKTVVITGMYVRTYVYIYYHYVYFHSTEAIILPTPLKINTFEDMPVKLKCTVKTNVQSKYKLIWMKEDEFVTGNGYSIESAPFDNNINTQNHYLTIHKAAPGAYTCMLISTRKKEIDSKTQHVVTESERFLKCLFH